MADAAPTAVSVYGQEKDEVTSGLARMNMILHHNARFVRLMERHLPHWQQLRERLNRLPVRHEDWLY